MPAPRWTFTLLVFHRPWRRLRPVTGMTDGYSAEIIDFLPDATLVIDAEGTVIAWNRAMEELTGVPAADVVGRGDHEYALPFLRPPPGDPH